MRFLTKIKRLRPNTTPKRSLLLTVLGVSLTAYGGYGLYLRYRATSSDNPLGPVYEEVTVSTDSPDETKIENTDLYEVPADQPRRIILDSLGVPGIIQKVSIDQNNSIGVPSNVHVAGWYSKSVLPGEPGVSLIDGHVSGKYTDGIFKKLGDLKTGDIFHVEYGDRSLRKFSVVSSEVLSPEVTAEKMLVQSAEISSQLNLITCTGSFNRTENQYTDRLLVSATLVPSL